MHPHSHTMASSLMWPPHAVGVAPVASSVGQDGGGMADGSGGRGDGMGRDGDGGSGWEVEDIVEEINEDPLPFPLVYPAAWKCRRSL